MLWLPDPGIDYPIVVGAGGGSRTDGGDSSFGSDLAIARGGSAGASAVSSFVAGGTGGHYEFGTYGFRGGDGGDASVWSGVARSGFGGSSSLGGGPRGVGSTTPEPMAGISARTGAWGAGGSGALLSVGGGMGHRGIVIVEAYA